MSSYSDLLRDPRWQRRRLEIMRRAEFCCEHCGAADRTLAVHHKYYVGGRRPWEYDDDELVCVCESCHCNEHEAMEHLKKLSIGFNFEYWRRLVTFAIQMAEEQRRIELELSDIEREFPMGREQ